MHNFIAGNAKTGRIIRRKAHKSLGKLPEYSPKITNKEQI